MSKLVAIPALIDPHVHFRVPGEEYKEDWITGARAAVHSGVTTVCDMPNNLPPCTTLEQMEAKKKIIESQLKEVGIPLRYALYLGADKDHFDEIKKAKGMALALKIFMGCSHRGLAIHSAEALEEAFRQAAAAELLVAVHAEDETILAKKRTVFMGAKDVRFHSQMRPKEAAIRATETAIELAKKHNVRLYLLHTTTKEELSLARQAKREGVEVFVEVTTHHLFFTTDDYPSLQTFGQLNPPLRDSCDREALWEGIAEGTIDTIGTDHAPHSFQEKNRPFGQAPSGMPGIETLLPLLLDAVYHRRLTLQRMIQLTHTNAEKIFQLPPNQDRVFVDLELEKTVSAEDMHSKCGWTPYRGMTLKGWPVYTELKGQLFYGSGFTPKKVGGKQQKRACPLSTQDIDFEVFS